MILAMVFQLKPIQFSSKFSDLGIGQNEFIKNRKTLDSIFQEKSKILIEVQCSDISSAALHHTYLNFKTEIESLLKDVKLYSVVDLFNLSFTKEKLEQTNVSETLHSLGQHEFLKDIISKNQSSFLIILMYDHDDAASTVNQINEALKASGLDDIATTNITSRYHLEDAIQKNLIHDIGKIILALLFMFLVVMWFSFRSLFSIFYLSFVVVTSVIGSLYFYQWTGVDINFITIIIVPIVIVLSAADTIHLLTSYYSSKQADSDTRLKESYSKYITPSFLTSLTTSIAFLSLYLHDATAIKNLAWVTALSIMFSFFVCYLTSPFLFQYAPKDKRLNKTYSSIADFFIKKKKVISYSLIPIFLISIFLLPKLNFQSDYEVFMPSGSQAKEEHDIIKEHYYSQAILNILIKKTSLNDHTLDDILVQLRSNDKISNIIHPNMKAMIPSKFMLPLDIFKIMGYGKRFLSSDEYARLQLRVTNPNDIISIKESSSQLLESMNIQSYLFSSPVLIYHSINKKIARSLFLSLVMSTIFLFIVFMALTKNFKHSLIGLFVNLIPLSFLVIIFFLCNLHINIMTAITAIVCLGLVVDDTIHSVYRILVLRQPLKELKKSMVTTTLLLSLGFAIFGLSSLFPIRVFGLTSSAIFLVTWICDMTILLYLTSRLKNQDIYGRS